MLHSSACYNACKQCALRPTIGTPYEAGTLGIRNPQIRTGRQTERSSIELNNLLLVLNIAVGRRSQHKSVLIEKRFAKTRMDHLTVSLVDSATSQPLHDKDASKVGLVYPSMFFFMLK